MKPLAIDLFCGLGGWTDGLLAEGYDVIGFDITQHVYGDHRYPAQLVVQDVTTLHGSQFRNAALIVASPPCQEYSYMAMPWRLAKAKAAAIRADTTGAELERLNRLFNSIFRIQREACEAADRHIPLLVENVRGAIPWVGRSRWNFGSFHLWGDVPALMPVTFKATKVPGFRFDGSGQSFQSASVAVQNNYLQYRSGFGPWNAARDSGLKSVGPKWDPVTKSGAHGMARWTNPAEGIKLKDQDGYERNHPRAFGWKAPRTSSGNVSARKYASAMIAKIPLPLSRHIAATYRPSNTVAEMEGR